MKKKKKHEFFTLTLTANSNVHHRFDNNINYRNMHSTELTYDVITIFHYQNVICTFQKFFVLSKVSGFIFDEFSFSLFFFFHRCKATFLTRIVIIHHFGNE